MTNAQADRIEALLAQCAAMLGRIDQRMWNAELTAAKAPVVALTEAGSTRPRPDAGKRKGGK